MKRAAAWVGRLYESLQETRAFGLAAETAFWLFLSLIPLAAVAGLVAARFTTDNWGQFSPVLGALPDPTRELVTTELVKVSRWNGGTVGVAGVIVFVWLGSSGVHAIFDALEIATGEARPWWRKRLLAWVTCVAVSIAVAALALLGPGLEGGLGWLERFIPALSIVGGRPTAVGRLVRFGVSLVVAVGYVSGLYWVGVPPRAHRRMPILPGAVVAVVLQAFLSFAYSTFMARLTGEDAYRTGLSIIGLTLMALYLFAVALLTGATVNRMLGTPTAAGGPEPRRGH